MKNTILSFIFLCGACTFAQHCHSSQYVVDTTDIASFLISNSDSSNPIDAYLQKYIREDVLIDFTVSDNNLLYVENFPDAIQDNNCSSKVYLKNQELKYTILEDSKFIFDSFKNGKLSTLETTLNLDADVDMNGRIKIEYGWSLFGHCNDLATDSIYINAHANTKATATLKIDFKVDEVPISEDKIGIKISPTIKLTGELLELNNVTTHVSDLDTLPGWDGAIASYLRGKITFSNVKSKFDDAIIKKNWEFQKKLAQEFLSEDEYWNWMLDPDQVEISTLIVIDVKDLDLSEIVLDFIRLNNPKFIVSKEYIDLNKAELAMALAMNDRSKILEIIGTAVACEMSHTLTVPMETTPLPNGVDYTDTSFAEWCQQTRNNGGREIGDADIWNGNDNSVSELPWTLPPGATFNVGTLPTKNNYQPYMKKVNYRTVNETKYYDYFNPYNGSTQKRISSQGQCHLEMRIYKKDINQTNLKPVMAIHGGSWKYRGLGFFGMESMISTLTENGFVVFAPFYRLVDNSDGPVMCNDATGEEVLADVQAALSWVENNMDQYGASGKVTLFGQSAGAHLSAYLALYHSNRIEKSLLMYPPTDIGYMVDQYNSGAPFDPNGVDALEHFLGVQQQPRYSVYRYYIGPYYNRQVRYRRVLIGYSGGLHSITGSSGFAYYNSFPEKIRSGYSMAPTYIVHGVSDALVPSNQATRLCNALAGNPDLNGGIVDTTYPGGNSASGEYKKTYECGNESKLTLISEADHMLDLCIPGLLCPVGSAGSILATKDALYDAFQWLKQ